MPRKAAIKRKIMPICKRKKGPRHIAYPSAVHGINIGDTVNSGFYKGRTGLVIGYVPANKNTVMVQWPLGLPAEERADCLTIVNKDQTAPGTDTGKK